MAALLLGALTACSFGSTDDVVEGRFGHQVDGASGRVLLPTGALTVTVGDPITDNLGEDDSGDGESHDVPGDGSFVPVSWSFDAFTDLPGKGIIGRDPQVAQVSLRVDGESIDLPDPYQVQGPGTTDAVVDNVYVPASTTDPEVRVEVAYDGHTQSFDPASGAVDAGVAEPLYASGPPPRPRPCVAKPMRPASAGTRISCQGSVERFPYLPGAGWADEGKTYVALAHRVRLDDLPGHEAVNQPKTSVELAGQAPVETLPSQVGSPQVSTATDVFEVPEDTATPARVSVTFTVEPDDDPEGETKFQVRAAIPIS